jgi:FHS family L-fucose permease-like MFS transporter
MPIITTEKVTSSQIGDGKSYKLAFSLVTSLFFLWGLANILNSALISHFQPVFTISRPVALLIETAFYLGYLLLFLRDFLWKSMDTKKEFFLACFSSH